MDPEQKAISENIILNLRRCGHFLHYKMGDKAGRRRIFFALLQHEELLQRDLQDILGVQSGSMSEIINKMEADGLIEKGRSETDGRNFVVRLTAEGKQAARFNRSDYDRKIELMMNCLDTSQQELLLELLNTVTAHWKKFDCEEYIAASPSENAEKQNREQK